jgi:hypothetical protein
MASHATRYAARTTRLQDAAEEERQRRTARTLSRAFARRALGAAHLQNPAEEGRQLEARQGTSVSYRIQRRAFKPSSAKSFCSNSTRPCASTSAFRNTAPSPNLESNRTMREG